MKRFYKKTSVAAAEGGFAVLLDGLAIRICARSGVADFRSAGGHRVGKLQGFGGVARHRRRRVILLLHRGGYAAEQRPEDFDHLGDPVHRLEAIRGVALQRVDFLRNILCGLLRLLRELFHFGSDYCESAAGFARASGFDRGVERQQTGLPRDRRNQAQHLTYLSR